MANKSYPAEAYIYACPNGCLSQGDRPIAASVRGWKKHMTRNHGGYNPEQLDAILGQSPAASEAGREAFLSDLDDAVPVTINSDGSLTPKTETTTPTPADTTALKTDAAARKLSAKMNKFKKTLADKVPQVLNAALKEKGPEWQLSDEDAGMLAEAVENCFEVLDVEFKIAPISAILSNPLWVLLLPGLVLLLIFGTKAAKNQVKGEPVDATAAQTAST